MGKEREYVVIDDLASYPDIKSLKAVVQGVGAEAAEVLEDLRAEILRRTQEMLADAAEAGVVVGKTEKAPKLAGQPGRPKGSKNKSDADKEPVDTKSSALEGWTKTETGVDLDAE